MIKSLSFLWHHKVGVVFFLFLVFIIGLFGVLQIDKTMYPNTNLPQYNVRAFWGNYSPEVIELKLTAPLERELSKLKFVKGIESQSQKGQSNIQVFCDKDYEIYEFELMLNESMRAVRDNIPENAFLSVVRTKPDEFSNNGRTNSFLTYRVFAPYSIDSLSRLVENEIKTSLSSIPGVSEVSESGLEKQAYFVTLKQEYRNMPQFSMNAVSAAIRSYFDNTRNKQGTVLRYKDDEFTVKFDEKLIGLDALKEIPISRLNNRVVKLNEIALINKGAEIKHSLIRFNGLDGISLDIKRRPDATAIKTAELVKAKMKRLEDQYNLKTQLLTDEGKDVQKKLDDLFLRVAVSLLVIFIITYVITRQLYNSFVVLLLLILSGLFSIFGLYITGNSINLYTIGGLALGFGMIIDNSLIVIERLSILKRNSNYKELVLEAIQRILIPVKVSTYTTIGAILPVFVMDELLKIQLSPFVIALAFSLVASLIISILFLPMLVKESVAHKEEYVPKQGWFIKSILWLGRKKKTSIVLLMMLIGIPGIPFYYFPMPNQIEGADTYNKVFNADLWKNTLKPAVQYTFGGALFVYVNDLKDKFSWGSFKSASDQEKKSLSMFIRPPSGTKLADINSIMTEFETVAKEYVNDVDHIYVNVTSFFAIMQIYFTDEQFATSIPEEIKDRFAEKTVNFGGIDLSISGVGDAIFIRGAGFPTGAQGDGAIRYELMGPNYDELKQYSEAIKAHLEENRRIKNIDITSTGGFGSRSQTQMLMNYNTQMEPYEYAWINNNFGSLLEKDETELRVAGVNGDESIYIKSEGQNIETVGDFLYTTFLDDSLKPVKIADLGNLQEEKIQSNIVRRDQIYVRNISFEYRAAKKRVDKYKVQFEAWIKDVLPEDIKLIEPEVDNFAFEKGMETPVVVLITLLIVFAIVAMYFESFKYTFAVFTIIPFSLVGITYFFYMMDQAFDSDALFGLMFVAGIVINNSAFVIYEIMQKRAEKKSMNIAVEETIVERARPILLTTVTTIVGILPLFLPQIIMQVFPIHWIAYIDMYLPTALSEFFLKNTNTDGMWYAMSLATISGCLASFLFSLWIPIVMFYKRTKEVKKKPPKLAVALAPLIWWKK
jgi:HAE1 family hydrophobic/amphiphilic exporter-1